MMLTSNGEPKMATLTPITGQNLVIGVNVGFGIASAAAIGAALAWAFEGGDEPVTTLVESGARSGAR